MVVAVVLLGLIGATIAWRLNQTAASTSEPLVIDAGAPLAPSILGRDPDEDVPPPPPVEEVEDAGKKVVATPVNTNQCDVKKCNGTNSPELENALQFRVRQAHRCYDHALSQDPTLRGKVTVTVRVGVNGQVCSAAVTSNDMGSNQVASCVAGNFRGISLPPPKGGCVDANIPINFVPRQ